MPLPRPVTNQKRKDFVSECMDDSVMREEFPNNKQRSAVCHSRYDTAKKSKVSGYVEWENLSYDLVIMY